MARGKNNGLRKELAPVGSNTPHGTILYHQPLHTGFEMDLTATTQYCEAHILYHAGQFVGTYMRVGIGQNCGACPVLAEDIQNTLYAAALFAARVELAVGIGTCTTLAKAVVRFGIDLMGARYTCQIDFAGAHIAPSLHNNGAQAVFNEFEGCKKARRARTHHYNGCTTLHVAILAAHKLLGGGLLVHENAQRKIYEYCTLARIDTAAQHAHGIYGAYIPPLFIGYKAFQRLFIHCLVRQSAYLKFVYHFTLIYLY